MVVLRLLGGAWLEGPDGPLTGRGTQRHSLALLALLATAPRRALPRERLLGLLWPETDPAKARQLLNVTVYRLRQLLGKEALLTTGDELALDEHGLECDAVRFESAVAGEDWREAAELYGGPFLDGFFVREAAELEQWAERERDRLALLHRRTLERLALDAERAGELTLAAGWWQRALTVDPYAAAPVLRLMRVLDALGERGRALDLAAQHARRLGDDLGAQPDAEVERFAARLRVDPAFAPEQSIERLPRLPLGTEAAHDPGPGAPAQPPPSAASGRRTRRTPWPGLHRWSLAPAAALALLVGVAAFLGPPRSPGGAGPRTASSPAESTRPTVAILSLEDRTGDAALGTLGFIAADWVAQGLARTGLVGVIPTSTVLRTERALAGGTTDGGERTLLGEIDATYVVMGAYYLRGDSVIYQISVVDPRDGSIVRAVEVAGSSRAAPLEGVEALRQRVVGALAPLLDARLARSAAAASAPPGYAAYVSYADGLTAFFEGDLAEASARFAHASADDPEFTAPLIWRVFAERNQRRMQAADSVVRLLEAQRSRLAPWDRAMLDYHAAFHRADWGSAYRAMERVLESAPGSEWTFTLAITAQFTNRPARAVELLRSIDPDRGWIRSWPPYWGVLSECLHQVGLHAEELAAVREMVRRFPQDPAIEEVRALAELDSMAAAERAFERVIGDPEVEIWGLERIVNGVRAAGHTEAAVRMAERALTVRHPTAPAERGAREEVGVLLLLANRLEEARAVFESLRESNARRWHYNGALGVIAARTGDAPAARRYLSMLKADAPAPNSLRHPYERGLNALWRARIAAQLGEEEEAMRYLIEAYRHGLTPHSAQGDLPELSGMWRYPPFAELMRPKG